MKRRAVSATQLVSINGLVSSTTNCEGFCVYVARSKPPSTWMGYRLSIMCRESALLAADRRVSYVCVWHLLRYSFCKLNHTSSKMVPSAEKEIRNNSSNICIHSDERNKTLCAIQNKTNYSLITSFFFCSFHFRWVPFSPYQVIKSSNAWRKYRVSCRALKTIFGKSIKQPIDRHVLQYPHPAAQ